MLSQEQVERMVKDANFVSGEHPYAPTMFDDLCCHVRALAADVATARAALAAASPYIVTLRQLVYAREVSVVNAAWERADAEGSAWYTASEKAGCG